MNDCRPRDLGQEKKEINTELCSLLDMIILEYPGLNKYSL